MSLFKKYGESLLDQPIGIEESRVRQQKEGDTRGSLQQEKRYQRVARRAYRGAMRDGNFGKAMDALDWIDGKSGGMDSGIMAEGVRMDNARNQAGNGQLSEVASTQPGFMGPPVPLPGQEDNFNMRLGLFEEIKEELARGGDISGFQTRASQLGITDKGFAAGSQRALEEASGMHDNASKSSTDSPSFGARLASFGGGGGSLFDRYSTSFA